MKKIALIGSTGSIGKQVIEVVNAYPQKFKIVAMSAERNFALFQEQLHAIKPELACLKDELCASKITEVPKGTTFVGGVDGARTVATYDTADVVFVACGGFAGLEYSLLALKSGKNVALANKETLVCGGEIVMPLVHGDNLVPVDSEHSAIWQCLDFNSNKKLKSLIITASGGALRNYTKEQLALVTPEIALNHPTWKMGKKITIDSATMLNKGYEIIEAHHLYSTPYHSIQAVVHPQSIIHSLVRFDDGALIAQLSNPSMILPIQMALTHPERLPTGIADMDFDIPFSLEFKPLDEKRYPLFGLALDCGRAGGIMPTVLNAVSEVADWAFINGQIKFLELYDVVQKVVEQTPYAPVTDFEGLCEVDARTRAFAQKVIKEL